MSSKIIKINLKNVKKFLPKRISKANKTHGGSALVIAGHEGMYGAAILAATAATRVGAGYVTLMTDLKKINTLKNPDFLTLNINSKINQNKFTAVAIGPGLGQKEIVYKKLLELKSFSKVVVDADALNVLAKKNVKLAKTWIVTPHTGELSRLLKISVKKINQDRKKYLMQACKKLNCHVLLKGHKTLVSDGKRIYEIQTGNKALAKAGTGDILTGMIVGFMAQGLDTLRATLLAATLHGKLADIWVRQGNDYLSLMASDLNLRLPKLIQKLRR
ncbi:MAG: NAD(P)H-hydrate dehydratase [Oligoflexia bacterium]|nr:NAD(P)H-hydrate dehydratase [Oligoflexia bacterium]